MFNNPASLWHWLGLRPLARHVVAPGNGSATAAPLAPVVHCRRASVDGLSIFYREAGAADAPVIVLLHGFPSSSHMFRDLIPLLADRFRVIAPDYPGFGHSDAPPASEFEYSFDRLAGVVDSLLDQLGVESAVFYMQDYGGPIGMRLAVEWPQRVAGLVVQNANAYMEGVSQAAIDVFMPLWQHGDETNARKLLLPATTRFQYEAGARDPAALNPDAWTHDQATLDRPGAAERQLALFRDYQSNVARYDAWHDWLRSHQPRTLIVWGKGDPFFTVAGAEAFTRDLTDVELHFFSTGHFALEEDALPIAALIRKRFAPD
ncbi:alpha/beta fold hydrolase [Derxia lacustris]|uniref:alpha/beta fold hydrolase n=1 Tax=Derxia lacustris TaxID=764842 RepID=UPI000A16ECBA|nr:alpha/beta hydrolase [Derxia lacustris]